MHLSPFLSPGRCGSQITAAFVDVDGNVSIALYKSDDKWTEPVAIPGLTKMTYVAVGEAP
jgi:hypothetical protein